MTGWTKEAREASARARAAKARGRSPAAKTSRQKSQATVTSLVDRVKSQAANRAKQGAKTFGETFTNVAKAGALKDGTPMGNYADYLGRWGHMRANSQGTLSDKYWQRKGVDPVAARADAARKRKGK